LEGAKPNQEGKIDFNLDWEILAINPETGRREGFA
jgi:hypothetical protein